MSTNPRIRASTSKNTPNNQAYAYWNNVLKSPEYILAPMVDQSELPWRMMARRHGADLCFTPMIHSQVFTRDNTYCCENITAVADDRPLIAQFCANEVESFNNAIKLMKEFVDGVDLNLGCPQTIARKGNYGAFLQENWTLIYNLVHSASELHPETPISAKIRVLPDEQRTIEYAQMLEGAGVKFLTVHGRTRDMKGPNTGLADWDIIRKVKENVQIPIIANGNIQVHDDLQKCLAATNADAVMSAEGHLHNPYIFEGNEIHTHWAAAFEYMTLVREYTAPLSAVRGHLFKLFHHSMMLYDDLRQSLAVASNLKQIDAVIIEMQKRCQMQHAEYLLAPKSVNTGSLLFPHWICQPYFRPLPKVKDDEEDDDETVEKSSKPKKPVSELDQAIVMRLQHRKRKTDVIDKLSNSSGLSKKLVRKLERRVVKDTDSSATVDELRRINDECQRKLDEKLTKYKTCSCLNPIGARCDYELCKKCCKQECYELKKNCQGHQWWFGDRNGLREMMEAKKRAMSMAAKMGDSL